MRTVFFNIGSMASVDENDTITMSKAIIVKDNVIMDIKDSQEAVDEFESSDSMFIDLAGKAVIPGLIDSHTHLLWAGDRFNEHKLRMEGKTYSEIAQLGGGIMETVRSTRQSSSDELFEIGRARLMESLRNGTTFVEAKSGYGLSTGYELALLSAVDKLKSDSSINKTYKDKKLKSIG